MGKTFASLFLVAGLAATAGAQITPFAPANGSTGHFSSRAVIWDQPWDGQQPGYASQAFADFPDFSSYCFDDFSIAQDHFLDELYVPGSELGINGGTVHGEIWSGIPGQGGSVVLSGTGVYTNGGQDLLIDFNDQLLPAGDYLVTAYVNREFGTFGQWYWLATTPVTGQEHGFWNPGGGFGLGTDYQPGSQSLHAGMPLDMAFTLTGTAVPTPGAASLIGLAGLLAARRRR